MKKSIRIGCASGFWGASVVATPQLLNNNNEINLIVMMVIRFVQQILMK